jgi:hypothetical protein
MYLREPYASRQISLLELWRPGPWQVKLYCIAWREPRPSQGLVVAGKGIISDLLEDSAAATHHYGLGFAGIHQGRGADFVFLGWWADENELHYHAFSAPSGTLHLLRPTGARGPLACVWDLAVIAHERQAWVETMLANPSGPDATAYLARCLNADV